MIKLVIVDDEYMIREGLSSLPAWQGLGIKVEGIAANGIAGWELVKQTQPDILLSDIRMPGMDGLQLCRQAIEAYPEMKCVLLTGYGEFAYAQQAVKMGVYDFLLKPTNEEELIAIMQRAANDIARRRHKDRNYIQLLCHRYMKEPTAGVCEELQAILPSGATYVVTAWSGMEQKDAAVLFLTSEWEESEACIRELLDMHLAEQHNKPDCIGVSERFSSAEQLPFAYRQARHACSQQQAIGAGVLLFQRMNHQEQIIALIEKVDRMYASPLTVSELSAEAYMSESYFSRLFKQVTGKKFIDYLTEKRIAEAKQLMRETSLRTYEVAQAVGYHDQRYFSQVFKKATGCTPSEYRSQENI